MGHDESANQSGGNAPTRGPRIFKFAFLALELHIECLGKVLTQEMARPRLQCFSILHHGFDA